MNDSKKETSKEEKREESKNTIPNEGKKPCCSSQNSGAFWAIILILVGLIFLFNNFNILPWNVWSIIWRFWPFFLILAGLQIILGKSWVATLIIAFVGF